MASKAVPNCPSFRWRLCLMDGIREAHVANKKPEIKKNIAVPRLNSAGDREPINCPSKATKIYF